MDPGQNPTEVPAWEASKENVLPIKRGRSAKGLSVSLAHPVSNEALNADQERAFERQINNNSVTDPLQKLEVYVRYLKWVRDTYPSVTDKALQILEKCTFELKDHDILKNDVRFISLWVEYADMVRTPGEIFTYMQSNKIGEKVALFWIAWAYVAEKALNYKLADQIFQKAVRRGPEPKDLLLSRYKQFQRRMARLYINGNSDSASSNSNSGTDSAHSNATVDAAITAAAMEAIRSAPSVAAPSTASNENTERSVLRRLGGGEGGNGTSQGLRTENGAGAATGAGPAGGGVTARRTGSSASSATGSSRTRPPSGSTSATTAPSGRQTSSSAAATAHSAVAPPAAAGRPNAGFQIFCDNPAATTGLEMGDGGSGGPAPTYKNLGTEAVRRKENDGPVTKWSEGPLLSNYVAPASATAPAIPIFVDEQFATAESLTSPSSSAVKRSSGRGGVPGSSPAPHVLSVRKQLDAAEGIAKNPLARHNLVQQASAAAQAPAAAAPSRSGAAPIDSLREPLAESRSNNIRAAVAPVAAARAVAELPVFTSAAPPAVSSVVAPAVVLKASQKTAPAAPPTGGLPFAIFSDSPLAPAVVSVVAPAVKVASSSSRQGPVVSVPAPLAATTAFSIYESPTAAGAGKVSSRSQTHEAPLKTAAAPTPAAGLSFSIYESPTSAPPAAPAPAQSQAVATKAVKAPTAPPAPAVAAASTGSGLPFSIFVDESPVASKPAANKPSAAQKSTLAFSIFESPSRPVPKIPVATTSTAAAAATTTGNNKKVLAPTAVQPPAFDIYEDESMTGLAPSVTQQAPRPAVTAGAGRSVMTPAATTPILSTPIAETPTADDGAGEGSEEQDAELQALLDNMMQADGEDGTINTRLARRDIDMMFCSPTIHRAPTTTQQQTRAVPVPMYAGDENSFCLKSAGGLFKTSADENEGGAKATTSSSSTQRAPLRPAPMMESSMSLSMMVDEEPDFDEFDNDYCGGGDAGDAGGVSAAATEGGIRGNDQHQRGTGGVLQKATHRPFGVHLDTFSAVKDLSAIKESSQEFSLCGMLETPGHTGTLGGHHHRYRQTGSSTGGGGYTCDGTGDGAGGRRDHRASYSAMGNMLMDLSYTGGGAGNTDFSNNSRESFGSVAAPTVIATAGAGVGKSVFGGFQIFDDSAAAATNTTTTAAATTGKRKGLSEQRPYTGIDADAAEPLPSRRRLYTPFGEALARSNAAHKSEQQQKRTRYPVGPRMCSSSDGGVIHTRPSQQQQEPVQLPPIPATGAAAGRTAAAETVGGIADEGSRRQLRQHHHSQQKRAATVLQSEPTVFDVFHEQEGQAVPRLQGAVQARKGSLHARCKAAPPHSCLPATLETAVTAAVTVLPPSTSSQPSPLQSALSEVAPPLLPLQQEQPPQSFSQERSSSPMDVARTASPPPPSPLLPEIDMAVEMEVDSSCSSASASSLALSASTTTVPSSASAQVLGASAASADARAATTMDSTSAPRAAAVVTKDTALSSNVIDLGSAAVKVLHSVLPSLNCNSSTSKRPVALEADTFYTLLPGTFSRILQHLCAFYPGAHIFPTTAAPAYPAVSVTPSTPAAAVPAERMQILALQGTPHPSCFVFRNKINTKDTFDLSEPAANCDSGGGSWRVVSNIGRGSYGHAILMEQVTAPSKGTIKDKGKGAINTSGTSRKERVVFKVDLQRDSVLWEAFIHMQIQWRLSCISPERGGDQLRERYAQYVLAPTGLRVYRDSAVLRMCFCEWGTLITVLRVLMEKGAFTPAEHEFLVAYLAEQMIQAVLVVHSAGILHCDIKTDNWLVSRPPPMNSSSSSNSAEEEEGVPEIRVRLIDFGRSLSACKRSVLPSSPTSRAAQGPIPLSQQESQEEWQEQYAELCSLYDTDAATRGSERGSEGQGRSRQQIGQQMVKQGQEQGHSVQIEKEKEKEEVRYRGDVSCKAYKCQEMMDNLPWSYQVDFHCLGNCIHQLLHLQPLTTLRESVSLLGTRGLDLQAVLRQLAAPCRNVGKIAHEEAQQQQQEGVHRYTVPQISLKRYWNKPVWSTVYLILFNFSAFLPHTASNVSGTAVAGVGTGAGTGAGAGAVQLLEVVLGAVRGLINSGSAAAVRKAALTKLSACLERAEI